MSFILECFAFSGKIVVFALCFLTTMIVSIAAIAVIARVAEIIYEWVVDFKDERGSMNGK